jgi:hypothetical protein
MCLFYFSDTLLLLLTIIIYIHRWKNREEQHIMQRVPRQQREGNGPLRRGIRVRRPVIPFKIQW